MIKTWLSIRRPTIATEVNKFAKGVIDYNVLMQKLLVKNPMMLVPTSNGEQENVRFREYVSGLVAQAHKQADEAGQPLVMNQELSIPRIARNEGAVVDLSYSTETKLLSIKMKMVLNLEFIIGTNTDLTEGKVMGSSVIDHLRSALGSRPLKRNMLIK